MATSETLANLSLRPHDVGFTGTSKAITYLQEKYLEIELQLLYAEGARRFHHGGCVGADAKAHRIAKNIGYYVICHPGSTPAAWDRTCRDADETRVPQDNLVRNHNIVDESSVLLATPRGKEQLRSGTWATIRYARKTDVGRVLFMPEGIVKIERMR